MNENLSILQVEDSPSDAALILRLLEKSGYHVHHHRVDDRDAMRAALEREEWDVILADHHMSQFDAIGALRVLHETGKDIPFIIVSGSIGEQLVVELMKSGAHDYVNKDHMARLIPVIQREVREARARKDHSQAERDLRDSEERLGLAIQATQLGTFDFSPKTGKLIWSELTRRHFGLPADAEVNYDVFLQGIHPDDRERSIADMEELWQTGTDRQYAAEFRTRGIQDGIVRWLSSWGRAFFDEQGKPLRLIGVTLDITDRKRLEEQFRQAQKMESIGRLAGGVAHDFNNLLTVINGYSDILLERLDARDPFHGFAAEIRKAGGRAADLTRQLLAFSRKQVVDPKPMNLNQLVSESRGMLARLIGEDIALSTRLPADLGNVCADAGQLHQVLMNLVVNARDAMPAGGCLTIETANADFRGDTVDPEQDERHGQYALLMVSDTGVGMDEETRRRLFEPFFTTKREGVGTGLGLATVYGIVKQCGGWIDVATAPGRGTRFTVGLPRTDIAVSPDRPSKIPAASKGSETVLVVEDQEEVRRLAVMVLRTQGYRLLEARSGGDALLIAERHAAPIHLLLTDMVMPGMNGKELADRLRSIRPAMRVLFISGYADNVMVNRSALGDEMDYLDKPFTPEALVRKIRSLLIGTSSVEE